jgi:hypothetical protein
MDTNPELLALDAESKADAAETQEEREHWLRIAHEWWSLTPSLVEDAA